MDATVKQLKAFIAIAETSSFAEACERLYLSQPALSAAIKKLEDGVGGQLFARSTRTVELTPEGRAFLPAARRLLKDWQNAFDDLERLFSLQQGSLDVAVMPSFACNRFPEALAVFRSRYPQLLVRVDDIVMEEVIAAVRSGRVDLGVTFEPLDDDTITFTPLFTDDSVAVLPNDHALARRRRLSWAALAPYPFIAMNRNSAYRAWTDAAQREAGAIPDQVFEAKQLATISRMVAAGIGVGVLPAYCHSLARSMGATIVPLDSPTIRRRVGVLSRRRHPLSVAAQRMTEVLQDTLADAA